METKVIKYAHWTLMKYLCLNFVGPINILEWKEREHEVINVDVL
jgi:hypothetical protein